MFRFPGLLLLFLLAFLPGRAQEAGSSHLRVSLLTIGVSDEIYATFGHTAIRVYDSALGSDLVYNYGTFNGFEENFELKYMRGKLLYYCSVEGFHGFMATYLHEGRRVEEQVLLLSARQKEDLYAFLKNNAREENRYYKYDFLYDNCATRIRDVFPRTFGADFTYGQTLPPGSRLTFRDIINRYLAALHWERLGINILLGSCIDLVMKNKDVMFLPDYLRDGIGNGRVGGQKVAAVPVTLLDGPAAVPVGPDYPFWLLLGIGLLTIAGLLVPALRPLGNVMSTLVLVVTGLLGCLIVFMWFGTDHQVCRYNWNVLWLLPTNVLVPFFRRRRQHRYALIAIVLLLVSLLLQVLRIQQLPLPETAPLMLTLLCIYGVIYRAPETGKTL